MRESRGGGSGVVGYTPECASPWHLGNYSRPNNYRGGWVDRGPRVQASRCVPGIRAVGAVISTCDSTGRFDDDMLHVLLASLSVGVMPSLFSPHSLKGPLQIWDISDWWRGKWEPGMQKTWGFLLMAVELLTFKPACAWRWAENGDVCR